MCVRYKKIPIKTKNKFFFIGKRNDSGGMPILRCPSFFESKEILDELGKILKKCNFNFNIIKIQKYRKNVMGINKHSDKIIDMKDGESIYIYRINKNTKKHRSIFFCKKENKKEIFSYQLKNNSLIEITSKENKQLLHLVPNEKK